jgi:C1A family cysteine protease
LALVALAAADEALYRREFNSFMRKYGKIYGQEEFNNRYAIFKKNYDAIKEPWQGVTKFSDLTPEEFERLYLNPNFKDAPKPDHFAAPVNVPNQDSIDWREKGVVTPVKDQGQCGSCWAFSTTGNAEGQWALAGHGLVSLSEQELVDCDKSDYGCNGGLMQTAYKYVIANGLDTEECYPYKAYGQTCKAQASCHTAKARSWEAVTHSEDAIEAYLTAHGPISIALNANWLQSYTGGIGHPSSCPSSGINHGILLVGYNNKDGGKKSWLIKNSWGTGWGERGYFRMEKGYSLCGITEYPTNILY